MMDILTQLTEEILKYIHLVYLAVFMVLTYTFKNSLHAILNGFFPVLQSKQWAVFIIGSVVAIPFWVQGESKMQLFVTYALGTSLHDLIISYVVGGVKSMFKPKSS